MSWLGDDPNTDWRPKSKIVSDQEQIERLKNELATANDRYVQQYHECRALTDKLEQVNRDKASNDADYLALSKQCKDLRERLLATLKHLEPLANIYDEYCNDRIDEVRASWLILNPGETILFSGRGGKSLLTLDDARNAFTTKAHAGRGIT